jgi:hypothetical protein
MQTDYNGSKCPACDQDGAMEKIPSAFLDSYKKASENKSESKPGDVVKKSIEEMRRDLEGFKKEMSEELFDGPN